MDENWHQACFRHCFYVSWFGYNNFALLFTYGITNHLGSEVFKFQFE